MTNTTNTVQVWPYYISIIDYVVFFLVLGTLSGIWALNYFRLTPRRRLWCPISPNAEDLPAAVVAVSLTATFAPVTIFLGIAAEIYSHGTQYWFNVIGYFLCVVVTAHAYLPVYYASGAKSTYDYIGKRFGVVVRRIIAATVILQTVLFIPFVLASPVLMFQHVTNFTAYTSLVIMGIVLVPPTLFNSLRATTWNDAVSFLLTVATLISITIIRMQEYGGFSKVWTTVENADLIQYPELSGDPFTRHTVWALLVGGPVTWCFIYSFNPCFVDRYLSAVTKTSSKIGLWCNFPFMVIMISVAAVCGLTSYAVFADCDPVIRPVNLTYRLEELVPLLVMRRKDFGFPGLFLGSIFGWTVGFVGSSINGLVHTTIAELVQPLCAHNITERFTRALHYVFLVIYTAGCLALVLTTQYFDNFLMASLGIFGIFGSPMLGIFTAAVFLPWVNSKVDIWTSLAHPYYHYRVASSISLALVLLMGVIAGFLGGLGVAAWLTIGPFLHIPSMTSLPPLSISGCHLINSSFSNITTASVNTTTLLPIISYTAFSPATPNNETLPSTVAPMLTTNGSFSAFLMLASDDSGNEGRFPDNSPAEEVVDRMSYLWVAPISCATVVLIALAVSVVTGRTPLDEVDATLICPALVFLMRHLPCSRQLNFGNLPDAEDRRDSTKRMPSRNDSLRLSMQRSSL